MNLRARCVALSVGLSVHEIKDLSAGRPVNMLAPLRGVYIFRVRVRVMSSNLLLTSSMIYCLSVHFDQERYNPRLLVYDKEKV